MIPVFNEVESLPELGRRLLPVLDELDGPAEVVLIDDGSTDGSFEVLRGLHLSDPRFRVLRLSRNFGHQIAITAGLEHAAGHAVVIMDADLQDPPEVVLALAEQWRAGHDVVYAVRDERGGESPLKVATAKWFYRVLGRMSEVPIPVDTGDFRLVDRRVVDIVNDLPEHRRYLRGLFAWVGYDQVGVRYAREARHAGSTKFPLRRMAAFAADGVVSFSTVPLRLALSLGFVVSVVSFLGVGASVVAQLTGAYVVPGWTSLVSIIGIVGGMQLLVLGVVGEYIARIYDEVKARPHYLLRDQLGGDQ